MLKKTVKWIGLVLGSLVLLLLVFYGLVYASTEARINKLYHIKPQVSLTPHDSAAYLAGRHVAEIRDCLRCHGADLATGEIFAGTKPAVGFIPKRNISADNNGIQYTEQDWIRVWRHDPEKDSKPLWIMPSHEICGLPNQDMAALIDYVKRQQSVYITTLKKPVKPLYAGT